MKRMLILSSLSLFSMYNLFACTATGTITPDPSPVPTVTISASVTVSPTVMPTLDPTPTPSITSTATVTPTVSPTATSSMSPMPTATPTSSPSSEYNYLIERARAIPEVASCINNSQNPSEQITGNVEVTGTCFVQGNTKRVTFTARPICAEGMLCAQYIKVIATVEFDCTDNVTRTRCGS